MSFTYRRRYQGKVQAVILDWAGTTVDYGSIAPVLAFTEVFHRNGIEITLDQARLPMGLEKKKHVQTLLEMDEISQQWREKKGRSWNSEDLDSLYRQFIPIQLSCLKENSLLIPGTLAVVQELRQRGIKIGTTTGYNSDMISIVAAEAKIQGFTPDCVVCSSEVPQGRPQPWMALEAAKRLLVYPMEACVKIGDTVADVEEGLNAGMWTIGLVKCGNEMGISRAEMDSLEKSDLELRLERARVRLLRTGAHFVMDALDGLPSVLNEIEVRLASGEKP